MARSSYLTESESQDFKESSNIRKRYTQDSGDKDLTIESLSEIPGIGEKVRKALVDHFGTETVALKVIQDSRVDLVAAVPGIGSRQAVNIVKGSFEQQFGVSSNMLLRTSDIRKIYESVLEIMRGYTNTTYAKDKLFLYFPLPPEKMDTILERQKYFADASTMAHELNSDQRETLKRLLTQVRGLYRRAKPRRIEGRVVITNDDKVFDKLITEGIDKWCPVYVLSEGESGVDYAQGYDLVLFISPFGAFDESMDMLDNVEMLGKDWSFENILPERTVNFYARNYRVIDASCKLAELFSSLPSNESMTKFTEGLDFEGLSKVGEILQNLDENGDLAQGIDAEIDRYRKAVKAFPTAIAETESWLNEEITTRISKSHITLGGQQIITILQSADMDGAESGALRNMLPAEVVETFTSTIQEAEDKLSQMLGLTSREADWVTGIINEEISLPVKMVSTQINDLEDKLRRIFADKQFSLIKKIANDLDRLREIVMKAVQTLLEFDLFLGVGLFSRDYEL
ncbi:MAG: helix-hairpin-helix domain-containing protein, partial [Candidatus Thorarchaeota archaeon]